ncbi:MAG TPA: glycosyltransferase [Bryobacteraceae bacterium]|nr:glycosyltransferase [Bryobacteraceae bacterium]
MSGSTRILHVLASLDEQDGGPVRAILDLSAAARSHGLESHLLAPGPVALRDNPLASDWIHVAPPPSFQAFRYAPGLREWLRRHLRDFDGVVIHGLWLYPGLAASLECKRASVPYACFPHGMLARYPFRQGGILKSLKKSLYWRLVERRIFDNAAAVLYTSKREWTNASPIFPAPRRCAVVAPFGIAPQARAVERPEHEALQQPPERKIALFLGRLHPIKNLEFLIEAWHGARPARDYHLVIAGTGEPSHAARLARLAAAGAAASSIHFTGHVSGDDKLYLLQRARWLLLPSLYESFGVAVLEAVQSGCAVAVSDQVSSADYLPPDSAVLNLRMETWIDFFRNRMPDDRWRSRTAEAERERFEARFRVAEVARNWAGTFRDLFSRTEPRNVEQWLSVSPAAESRNPAERHS